MADYTHTNLAEVEDSAVKGGFLELLVFSQSAPGDAEIVGDFFDE